MTLLREGLAFNKNMQDQEKQGCSLSFYTGSTVKTASRDLTKIFLLLFTGIHIHRLNTQGAVTWIYMG